MLFRDRTTWDDATQASIPVFEVIEYVEGDVTQWHCPTKKLRQQITDELAFFHWKHNREEWVTDYESVDQLPEDLRGPYSARRQSAASE